MQLLKPSDYQTMPWKNGGGITHEIALAEGSRGFAWRLSIAEVATSGAFSKFEGKARILTVIEGNGIDLVSKGETLAARPKSPVAFSGETEIDGRLIDGPIRDFNLIYDPKQVWAEVAVVDAETRDIGPIGHDSVIVVHSVIGNATCDKTRIGNAETLILRGEGSRHSVSAVDWAIVVQLTER